MKTGKFFEFFCFSKINLFHGKKSDDNLGDQKIVKAAAKLFKLLSVLTTICI
jgi:hypothetical protein